MNTNRFFCLLFSFFIPLLCLSHLAAQNDRGPALHNVPALIASLGDTKPLKQQVANTYSPTYFNIYSAAIDHVQGIARLANGNYAFSHSTNPNQKSLIVFSRPNDAAVYRPFSLNDTQRQSHPSGIQACGNIVAIPTTDDVASIHFFDGSDPDNPVELTHLRITYFEDSTKPLNTTIDAVGLVYHEINQKHYLTVSVGSEQGKPDGTVWLFESNGKPLTDPDCRFNYIQADSGFTSASGYNLLYDASGELYGAATYRTLAGEERLHLAKITFDSNPDNPESNSVQITDEIDLLLSKTDIGISPSPGFRWGGGLVVTGPNSVEVIGSARLLTGGAGADYCVIKIWKSEAIFEDCRKYSEVSWLTSHKAYSAPQNGFGGITYQSLDLEGQLDAGVRAFQFDTWEVANLNAPNAGPIYQNLVDGLLDNQVYLLNDPYRLKENGNCCDGTNTVGTAWPSSPGPPDFNRNKVDFGLWLEAIKDFLEKNPTEIITIFLEDHASFENHLDVLEDYPAVTKLIMNQSDYDNLYNLTLGEIRASGRRLVIFRNGETRTFTANGNTFQFRSQFEKTVENTVTQLPNGLNTCDKRDESAPLNTGGRLVVFNHLGQPYHSTIVRRWLEDCSNVNVPNFVVVNFADAAIFGIQPKDAVREFNRRLVERAAGTSLTYRIMVAGSDWNITQESNADGADVLTSNNPAEWEFILSDDDRSYYIRLKGTNRYIIAPANLLNSCFMSTDNSSNRARWYVEPLGGNAVRLYCKHEYAGVKKAMREVLNGDAIKMSDNIDFVSVDAQKFELVPVNSLGVTCKSATVELDANGTGLLAPEAVKQQVASTIICESGLYFSLDTESFSCSDLGNREVTLTVSDGAALSSSCTATVTVVNNLQPTIVCKNKVVYLDANGTGSITPADVLGSIQDNCGVTTPVSVMPNTFNCSHIGNLDVTLTVSDGQGGNLSCTATVIIIDNIAPSVICKPYTAQINAEGMASISPEDVFQSGTDNCGFVNRQSVTPGTFTCNNLGTNTITLTVNDGHSNSRTCTATVTVADNLKPTVVCKNATVYLDASGNTGVTTADVFQSGADNCGTVNQQSVTPNSFTCNNLGANTVTLTVNDGHNNTQTCTATVTVADNIKPTVVCKNATVYLDASGNTGVTTTQVFQSGTDNCGTVNQQAVSPNTFACNHLGANTVTLTVNDGHGNTQTCTATVTVVDNLPPAIVCPGPIARNTDPNQCSAVVNYTVSGSDNCTYTLTQTNGFASGMAFPTGTNVVNWKVTDAAGQTAICSFTITVTDNQTTSITCPANISKNTDPNQCSAVVVYTSPSFSDNCTGAYLTRTSGQASGTAFATGTHMINWKATDGAGNSSVCNFTVTVSDAQGPTIACPANLVKSMDPGQCTAVVTYTGPIYSDNCTGASAQLLSGAASGSTFQKGTNTVVWKATDGAGTTATCAFTVTVNDSQPPSITCPGNQTKSTDPNNCTAVATYTTPTFTDNCAGGSVTLQSGLASGAAFLKGINTVIWKATDAAGLTKTCTFRITINDTQAPTITCPANQNKTTDANGCTAIASYATATFTDNCTGGSVIKLSGLNSGAAFPKGTNNVVFKATDAAGNQSLCSLTITVTDVQLPIISCPANMALTAPAGSCSAVVPYPAPSASDNCAIRSNYLLSGMASGSVFPQGVTTNVWKATDDGGLTATCAFTVTVSCGTERGTRNYERGTMNYERGTRNDQRVDSSSFIVHRLSFHLAPNPATTTVLISVEGVSEKGGLLTVFDAAGRMVWQQPVEAHQTSLMLDVAEKNFAGGIYFVTLRSQERSVTKRLIVSKL